MFLGFFILFRLFVPEFAKVHEAADGRDGVGGDLDEVHAVDAGQIEGIAEAENAKLFAVRCDYADFAGTDFPIYPVGRTGEGRRTWRKRATQDTLVS